MVVRSWTEDPCTVVRVSGELDMTGAPRLRAILERASAGNLVIDLTEVPFCDSVGLGVLVETLNRIRSAGGRLILVVSPGMIANLLVITNLDQHFDTRASMDEALAAMPHPS
ncbi:STAS domain-containing protein [Nonomuraea sp. NPDC050556]|uniref:STAS domain-containing protein n=1 Tax=Nonomuraea sp. NPDC050556 TaxID=3364369 RepID=UPI0037931330